MLKKTTSFVIAPPPGINNEYVRRWLSVISRRDGIKGEATEEGTSGEMFSCGKEELLYVRTYIEQ